MMNRKKIHNDFSKYLLEPSSNGNAVSFSEFIRRTAVVEEQSPLESSFSKMHDLKLKTSLGYLKSLSFNQLDYLININGRECFDAIIRFENLSNDFCKALRPFHQNIHADWLERKNTNPMQTNYRDYYINSDDRRWVATLYERDIDYFKYVF
jgi:hypothetical protein